MIKRFRDEAISVLAAPQPPQLRLDHRLRPEPGRPALLAMEYVKVGRTPDPAPGQRRIRYATGARDRHHRAGARRDRGSGAPVRRRPRRILKADNIILDQRRAGIDVVKIVDFGIARIDHRRARRGSSISGTPEYMAPEVIRGAPPSFASGHLRGRHQPVRAASVQDAVLCRLDHRDPENSPEGDDPVADVAPRSGPRARPRRHRGQARSQASVRSLRLRRRRCGSTCSASSSIKTWSPRRRSDLRDVRDVVRASLQVLPRSCGTPRMRVPTTLSIRRPPAAAIGPDRGAAAAIRRPHRETAGPAARSHAASVYRRRHPWKGVGAVGTGFEGAGRHAAAQRLSDASAADGRVIYQIGPDPSGGSPRRSIRSARCSPRCSSCLQCRARSSCATPCFAIGLNERDIPGIAQLFGHPGTTLLELEHRWSAAGKWCGRRCARPSGPPRSRAR